MGHLKAVLADWIAFWGRLGAARGSGEWRPILGMPTLSREPSWAVYGAVSGAAQMALSVPPRAVYGYVNHGGRGRLPRFTTTLFSLARR